MRKIDIHTHILPEALPDLKARYGYGGFITLAKSGPRKAKMLKDDGTFFREVEDNCWNARRRVEQMDETGVAVQVLSTVPVMFSYWAKAKDAGDLSRLLNDDIARTVREKPDRFIGLGSVPLQDASLAIKELRRCVEELGLAGVQIGTNVDGRNLDDPGLFAFFEAASQLGAAVFVHPWDVLGRDRMKKYWLPWLVGMPAELSLAISSMIFAGVFERLPKLRVAFAHGGGSFGATLGRIEHGFKARPDLCAVDNKKNPRAYLRRFYVDSLVHDPAMLKYLIELFGEDRVALGSDYPFPLGESKPGALIDSMKLGKKTRERLLEGTAREWLGIKREAAHAL
ncbi:MAG: amidohydrolase [Elusimicrobia bacterium]|nr:amidohydrolase [Elusimicrobiota bacterium]